ncbi:ependymin-related protein [Acrasis kona]|uniref:Ependymin-related protein n=1 Tax=Acrasis kona TaxID=1008807 RepID=A0AAW2Z0X8_9EUKA
MRSTFALIALLAIAAFVFAEQHCIGEAFTTTSYLVDPSKDFDDQSQVWYDSATNKQRVHIDVFEPEVKHLEIYYRHDLGKAYELDKETGKCTTFPLAGRLEPFCLAENATKVGTATVGLTLKTDVWEENVFGFQLRLLIAPNGKFGVPVNIISRGHTRVGATFQEWWDFQSFKTLPDQSIFDLPEECKNVDTNNFHNRNAAEVSSPGLDAARRRYGFLSRI